MTTTEDKEDIDNEDAMETALEEVSEAEGPTEYAATDVGISSSIDSIKAALQEDEDRDPSKDGCCLRFVKRQGCCGRCISRWPRFWALFLGVTLPLWLLISLSVLFGSFLARAEAPSEIQANNEILEAQTSVSVLVTLISNFVEVVPTICFELYVADRDSSELEVEFNRIFDENQQLNSNVTSPNDAIATILSDDTIVINKTDMYDFMAACGAQARPIVEVVVNSSQAFSSSVAADLTFNWIRCVPWANGLDRGLNTHENVTSLQPDNQARIFRQVWSEDQQQLQEQYLQEYLDDVNTTVGVARVTALTDSLRDATGGSRCEVNVPASAWFWFTVMTTVGYGNQAPLTTTGKTLVYTLGFLSMLAFGGVLAVAGYIVSFIFDDVAARSLRLRFLCRPWVSCLVFGAAYYGWMLVIAGITQQWKEDRLKEEFSFREGYWFSYISTTTVGLGDIFLEPEVIIGVDLVVFPLLFLVGFVFLSSFLGKLVEAISHVTNRPGTTNIVEVLLASMKYTQVVPDLHDIQELADFGGDSEKDSDEAVKENNASTVVPITD